MLENARTPGLEIQVGFRRDDGNRNVGARRAAILGPVFVLILRIGNAQGKLSSPISPCDVGEKPWKL